MSADAKTIEQFALEGAQRSAERAARPFRGSKNAVERSCLEMKEMAESGDWSEARGTHVVALYAWLHACVYGVEPSELTPKQWGIAAAAATRMVDQEFKRDYGSAVQFLRWTWKREQKREEWRRQQHRDGGRIGWRLQFSNALIVEYRLSVARVGSR